MTQYPCPFCGAAANLDSGCPGCGRGPDPEAAEVIRLAAEIGQLTARLAEMQYRRNALAARVRARTRAPVVLSPPSSAETSTKTVQNVLFILGGLLLGTGAVVFTAVAWTTFGVPGRAAILAGVTVLALAAPVLALWRRLAATAETFAAVGLLLVLLDGYAAWSVDLFGVAGLPRGRYAAAVCAVTAAVAAGYGAAVKLRGPRFAALAVAQPVLPLAAAELRPSAAGWALVLSVVAVADLALRRVVPVAGWVCYGLALAGSAGCAWWSEVDARSVASAALAGAAVLTAAVVLSAGAGSFRQIADGVLVGALVLAAGRLLALAWPDLALVLVVAATAVVAGAVALGMRLGLVRLGAWASALVCLSGVGVYTFLSTLADADWQLPVAVTALAAGLVVLLTVWRPARAARPYAIPACCVLVAPALWEVLATPYRWLGDVWAGRPDGSGVSIPDGVESAVALAVLAVAAVLFGGVTGGLLATPLALLVGLAAMEVPWPAIPATSLVLGLAGLLAVVIGRIRVPTLVVAVPLVGAGLAGALPLPDTTLAGLGLVAATGSAAGAAARTLNARICGWVSAVAAAVSFAVAAAFAAGVERVDVAFWTLAAAGVALALGGVLKGPESQAVDAAAHAGAVVALLLTFGSVGYAAAVCTLWGLAVGLRALWPAVNRVYAGAAAGCELLAWWLLLASREVAVVEAYTLPAALVALLFGVLVRRARVHSWVAYGPALAAAFLPSLATILVESGAPMRRLALGLGALAVLVLGSGRRNQAPVVVGGVVLAVVALHELALVWQLLPTWIPLTAAGLLLVWLAVTYERRRRDLARLRTAVNRMT